MDIFILCGIENRASEEVSRSEFRVTAMGTFVFFVLVTTTEDVGVLERVAQKHVV